MALRYPILTIYLHRSGNGDELKPIKYNLKFCNLGKGHHKSKGWKGWKGEQAGITQCFLSPVEKCTLIPQDSICKEIEVIDFTEFSNS